MTTLRRTDIVDGEGTAEIYEDSMGKENDAMCREQELTFSIFMLYSLADKWKKSPVQVYQILNTTGILDDYVIGCYDVLHTQGKEYLVEDITEYVREKGVSV